MMDLKLYSLIFVLYSIQSLACRALTDDEIKAEIDNFVEQAMECADIPGLTLSVVKDGKDFIAKGYGVRNRTQNEVVTNETLFLLASVTKAFTGVTAAILLSNEDDGQQRLSWRTPIRDFLLSVGEEFYFNDTLRSQFVNLRDLFGHRTGLSFNNPLRIYGYGIDEAMHRLQYLPIVNDFRDDFVFNNLLFGLAGWVVEKADGRSWEDFTWDELLVPLGMTSSVFMKDESHWDKFATGHYVDDNTGEPRGVSLVVTKAYFEAFSAAGSIGTNAIDMLQWLKFQLNNGTAEDGTEILSTSEFIFTHIPSMQKQYPPRLEQPDDPVTYKFGTHSVAWNEHTYRDRRISQHVGGETGFLSLITVGRSEGFGIFTGLNKAPHQGTMDNIHMYIMDLLLGVEPWLNGSDACNNITFPEEPEVGCDVCQHTPGVFDKIKEQALKRKQSKQNLIGVEHSNVPNERNNVTNDDLIGRYGHYGYGNVTIGVNETTNQLYMIYGLDGKYDWTWDLYAVDEDLVEYEGVGRDLIWYYKVAVLFEVSDDVDPDVIEINRLFVDFDRELPPSFARDLDWLNEPPPPVMCGEPN